MNKTPIHDYEAEFLTLLRKSVKNDIEIQRLESLRHILEEQSKLVQQPLLQELSEIGINVSSVWDLVNTRKGYGNAIPVLLKHLKYDYPDKIKEGIIRALSIKEAKGKVGNVLINTFYDTPKENVNLRWAIGNTMRTVISENDIEDILKIVYDKSNGESRKMFVLALAKLKLYNELITLIGDEQITVVVLKALGQLKSKQAIEKVTELLNHSNESIRKEASLTLKKLDGF